MSGRAGHVGVTRPRAAATAVAASTGRFTAGDWRRRAPRQSPTTPYVVRRMVSLS